LLLFIANNTIGIFFRLKLKKSQQCEESLETTSNSYNNKIKTYYQEMPPND